MNKNEAFRTVLILSIAFLGAFFIFKNSWLAVASALLLTTPLFGDNIIITIASFWTKTALQIGVINTKLILFLTFYIFLTPLAVLYRLFDRRAYRYFSKNDRDSLFSDVNKRYDKDSFNKLW